MPSEASLKEKLDAIKRLDVDAVIAFTNPDLLPKGGKRASDGKQIDARETILAGMHKSRRDSWYFTKNEREESRLWLIENGWTI